MTALYNLVAFCGSIEYSFSIQWPSKMSWYNSALLSNRIFFWSFGLYSGGEKSRSLKTLG